MDATQDLGMIQTQIDREAQRTIDGRLILFRQEFRDAVGRLYGIGNPQAHHRAEAISVLQDDAFPERALQIERERIARQLLAKA